MSFLAAFALVSPHVGALAWIAIALLLAEFLAGIAVFLRQQEETDPHDALSRQGSGRPPSLWSPSGRSPSVLLALAAQGSAAVLRRIVPQDDPHRRLEEPGGGGA